MFETCSATFRAIALSCFASGDFDVLICYAVKWGSSVTTYTCVGMQNIRTRARVKKGEIDERVREGGGERETRDALSRCARASARLQRLLGRLRIIRSRSPLSAAVHGSALTRKRTHKCISPDNRADAADREGGSLSPSLFPPEKRKKPMVLRPIVHSRTKPRRDTTVTTHPHVVHPRDGIAAVCRGSARERGSSRTGFHGRIVKKKKREW